MWDPCSVMPQLAHLQISLENSYHTSVWFFFLSLWKTPNIKNILRPVWASFTMNQLGGNLSSLLRLYHRSYVMKLDSKINKQKHYVHPNKKKTNHFTVNLWQKEKKPHLPHSPSFASLVTQLKLALCDPMDCSPPGSSVHRIFQAKILEWVSSSFSRGSSPPRDRTWVSCIAGNDCLPTKPPGKPKMLSLLITWHIFRCVSNIY